MTNYVYGGVKNSADGVIPEGVPALQPNGKKPAHAGLGAAYKDLERPILPERADWDPAYFNELVTYEPKHFGLSSVQIKPYCATWMQRNDEKRWTKADHTAKMQTARTVRAALAEWGELWGDEPTKAVYPRYADQTWRSEKQYDVLRTIRDKRETGYYSKPPKSNEDVVEAVAAAKAPIPAKTIDEMVEAVVYAAEHWESNPESRELFDGFYLRENGMWLNLKHPSLINVVVVALRFNGTGPWEVNKKTIRGEVRAFLIRVKDNPRPFPWRIRPKGGNTLPVGSMTLEMVKER